VSALALAWVLGMPALILTGVVVLLAGFAGANAPGHQTSHQPLPLILHSGVTILLPWLLVLLTLTGPGEGAGGGSNGSGAWILAILWSLHLLGASRRAQTGPDRIGLGLMALASLGMIVLLIQAQTPIGLAVLAALWLPAWLFTVQGRHPQRISLLWTASMLASALALGSGL